MIYLKILEFGNPRNEKMILIHGFESPYQVWEDYIKYFEKDYFIIVPILTGHNPEIKEDFVSFESEVKELEQYYINKFGNDAILTKQYLTITEKARQRDENVVAQAVGSMVKEKHLEIFLKLLDNMSDTTIVNYLKAVGSFKLPPNIDTPSTEIYYLHGTKMAEMYAKKTAKYIKKNYPNANIITFDGKEHCEDALINSEEHINVLNKILR